MQNNLFIPKPVHFSSEWRNKPLAILIFLTSKLKCDQYAIAIYLVLLFFVLFNSSYSTEFSSYQAVKDNFDVSEFTLLDRSGKILHQVRKKFDKRQLDWIGLEDISSVFIDTIILAEDRRFYSHHGVDYLAILSSFSFIFKFKRFRGASTITMQLAKVLSLKNHKYNFTFLKKISQVKGAWDLESRWKKKEILEAYLNLIYFRGELRGINAASIGLFNKHPSCLNRLESIILSVLVCSPNSSLKKLKERSHKLLLRVNETFKCNLVFDEIDQLIDQAFNKSPKIHRSYQMAYHLTHKIKKRFENVKKVISTLDFNLQKFVIKTLDQKIAYLIKENLRDVSVLVVENNSGNVISYVGSSSPKYSESPLVDGIVALRQAGSTLKPFIYGIGIENKILTASSIFNDSPLQLKTIYGIYRPQNYDNHFKGLVTLREALASSLNIPAVKALNLVGGNRVVNILEKMDFRIDFDGSYYGPALALGSLDISLLNLVNAYRMIANEGIWSPLRYTISKKDKKKSYKRIFSSNTTYILKSILSDNISRSITFGPTSFLKTPFWTAVKTGTSKDMRDNWCVGFSSRYTVGVWAGNFSGKPMYNVGGVSGAGPIWSEIMFYLHKKISSNRPVPSTDLIQKNITIKKSDNVIKKYREWYIKGTEPLNSIIDIVYDLKVYKIKYPIDKMTFALDPDIPEKLQKIAFDTTNWKSDLKYFLNGKEIEDSKKVYLWKLQRGRFVLLLRDRYNKMIDKITFFVK